MNVASRTRGFWRTAPGILTGVAAVMTAVGGLLTVLLQIGVIGERDGPASDPAAQARQAATPHTATTSSAAAASRAVPGKPWSAAEARWTLKDGKVLTTRAETVRFCFSGGVGVNLDEIQSIAFEKMSTVEVLRSDVALSPGGKATLRITMADGQVREGSITSGCDFFGFSEDGTRYSLYPDKLLKIEFLR